MITTKENMCEVAVSMFKEFGFEQVSINMICNKLKVTRGSFYHHFTSKNDLLLFWFSTQVTHIALDLSLSSPKQILKKLTLEYAAILQLVGHDFMYHILMADFELEGKQFHNYLNAEGQSLDLIHTALEMKEIHSSETAKRLFDAYIAAMIGSIVMWKFENGEFDIVNKIGSIFDTIFN